METDLTPDAAIDRFLSRLKPVRCLVVAVSGGSDSTALLHLLRQRLKSADSPRLVAVTVDHRLREGSGKEARLVAALCAEFGIEHRTAAWKGRKPKTGLQEAARLARYDLLSQEANSVGADAVVTGHTQDDQIETAIMRGERAPGRGLSGMAEAVLFKDDCWVLRPLLAVRRDALQAVLRDSGVPWIDDPSNDDERFERVRLRRSGAASQADTEVLSMIGSAASARRHDAQTLARFVDQHGEIHGGIIAELPQVPAEISEPLQQAIGLFAALMGGRAHVPGAKQQVQIARFSADVGPPRANLGRSVLDRRADRIFIYREKRNLPRLTLKPGQTGLWDNRYWFENRDLERSFVIAPAASGQIPTELRSNANLPDNLPPGVVSRAAGAEPVIFEAGGDTPAAHLPGSLTLHRHLALFDLFLPEFDLILADRCADLFGRADYREPLLAKL